MRERINRPLFYLSLLGNGLVAVMVFLNGYGSKEMPPGYIYLTFFSLSLYLLSLTFTVMKEQEETVEFVRFQLGGILVHATAVALIM